MSYLKNIKTHWYVIFLIFVAVALAAIPVTVSYKVHEENTLANAPVDVIKNWTIHVDNTKIYHPGDTVIVDSHFTKLLDVTGTAVRYIQCRKPAPNQNEWDALYLANKVPAVQGKTANGHSTYNIGIPLNPGVLPSTCRLYIASTYDVNEYHPAFQEHAYSNTFTVQPVDLSGKTIIYTNDPQTTSDTVNSIVKLPDQTQPIIIYENNTGSSPAQNDSNNTTTQPSTDDESIPENAPTTNEGQKNIIQRVVGGVTNLLGGL